MNILKFSLSVSVLSFLLIACGGSGDSGGKSTPSFTEAETIEQAENNLYALGYILSGDSMRKVNASNKVFDSKLTLKKERIIQCDKGTVEIYDDEKGLTIIYKACTDKGEYRDGTVITTADDGAGTVIVKYSNYTLKKDGTEFYLDLIRTVKPSNEIGAFSTSLNGVNNRTFNNGEKANVTYSNFIKTSTHKTQTYNGKLELESKCITGTYIVETVEKLVFSTQYKITDSIVSGTLKLNGATYTYEAPYVTIEAGGESKTYFQSKIKKRMNGYRNRNCAI